jgi:hypothetical protein
MGKILVLGETGHLKFMATPKIALLFYDCAHKKTTNTEV